MTEIKAKFVPRADGSPDFIASDDLRHYKIELFVENAPPETHGVTYQLHDSYFNPVREADNNKNNFAKEITSYGDYSILATIRSTNKNPEILNSTLYDALKRTYANVADAKIKEAIDYIKTK